MHPADSLNMCEQYSRLNPSMPDEDVETTEVEVEPNEQEDNTDMQPSEDDKTT